MNERSLTASPPHLACALTLQRLTSDPSPRTQTGVVVFRKGRAAFVNRAADAFLGHTPPESLLTVLRPEGSGIIHLAAQSFHVTRVPWTASSLLRSFLLDDGEYSLASTRSVGSSASSQSCHAVPLNEGATIVALQPFRQRTDFVERLRRYGLSPRQQMVADGVLGGLSNAEIAIEMCISERTVKDHLCDIFHILDVHSRAQVIARLIGTLRQPHLRSHPRVRAMHDVPDDRGV